LNILSLSTCPLDPTLGSGKTRLRWTEGLRALGHTVDVAEPKDFETWHGLRRGLRFRQAYGATTFIKERIRSKDYDVIECFGGEFGLMLKHLAKLQSRPFTIAHTDGLELLASERELAYNPPNSFRRSLHGWYSRQTHERLSRAAFVHADAFVASSEVERRYVLDLGLYLPHRAAAIEPGLDPLFLSVPFTTNRGPTIAFTGTWIPRKGIESLKTVMSRILNKHREVRLFLYGTGEPSAKVLASFPAEVRDRVTARSRLTGREIADGLSRASIFLFPTYYEGFGMALSEAMACGCAPVTTPTGFGATLAHGEEALVCDFGDEDAMERSVLNLLHDPALRDRIASNAWERVRGLTWKANIARLEDLYVQWASEHQASRGTSAEPAGRVWAHSKA